MNQGATKASATNRGERYHFTISAYYFLSRGYAVALPMMRGFAGLGGGYDPLAATLAWCRPWVSPIRPASGYAGTDALTIEEVSVDGKRQVLRIELTVM